MTFTFEWSSQLSGSGSQEVELTNVVSGIYILKWEEFLATLNDTYIIPHVTRVTSKATRVTPKTAKSTHVTSKSTHVISKATHVTSKGAHVTSKGAHEMCGGKGTA